MATKDSIVGVLVLAMGNERHHLAFGGGIASKFVCRHFRRDVFLAFQQLTGKGLGVAIILAALHEDVQHVVSIDGTPEILALALN